MRLAVPQDPLVGTVFSGPTRWPGQRKLLVVDEDYPFDQLKARPGVMYRPSKDPNETGWYIPQSMVHMGRLGAELYDYEPDPVEMTPGGIRLHEYQRRTITFLRQVDREHEGCILAADMGLGKVIMSLMALYLDGYLEGRGLVCGPAGATGVWCDEWSDPKEQFGLEILPLEGMKNIDPSVLMRHPVVYCHYGILQAWQPWIFSVLHPNWVIFDESHNLAKGTTQRSEAARQISMDANITRRYLLTGTPIPNRRLELWSQLAVAQPRQWSNSHFDFGVWHCAGQQADEEDGGHWTFEGESHDAELRARLAGTMVLYTRFDPDVACALPELTRTVEKVGFSSPDIEAEYDEARFNIIEYLKKQGKVKSEDEVINFGGMELVVKAEQTKPKAVQLVSMTTLVSILSKAKCTAAVQMAFAKMQEHKHIVIFTWRVESARWIANKLLEFGQGVPIFGPVHGEMKIKDRRQFAHDFRLSEKGVWVATRGSSGESINDLVAANYCIMVDLFWNPTSLLQAESRLHRGGQEHDKVEICYLQIPNTLDDYMLEMLQQKATVAANVAERNQSGVRLVRDLVPSNVVDDQVGLDTLCAALLAAGDEDY